jgi:hypothetical protein
MDFGIIFANTGAYTTPKGAITLGQCAEANGFDSVKTSGTVIYTLTCSSTGAMPTIKQVGGAVKSGSCGSHGDKAHGDSNDPAWRKANPWWKGECK